MNELYLERDGLKIYAEEHLPASFKQGEKYPAIIISHGFAGNCSGVEQFYCDYMSKQGYAAYCYDFCGGSFPGTGKSEGDQTDMSIRTEMADLKTVLNHVKGLGYIDTSRIVLMGTSQGGFVSALVAAEEKDSIWKIILVYPALTIPYDARKGALGGASYDINNVPDKFVTPFGMPVGRRYHDEMVGFDPFVEIRKFEGDVLLFQGTKDSVTNYSFAERALNAYKPGQCRLLYVSDADHGFDENTTGNVMTVSKLFLDGKEQQLTVQVFVTGYELVEKDEEHQKGIVYFTGYCDCDKFHGAIKPGARDTQLTIGDGPTQLYAEYTLDGIDAENNHCTISIINTKVGDDYKPVVKTNSKLLEYLNTMDITATLDFFNGGLTVRFFG